MDDSDFNGARRNLLLLSIGFIAFTLGEGTLTSGNGNQISVMMGTITFKNPTTMYVLAWILLGWFYARFVWLSDRGQQWHDFSRQVQTTRTVERMYRGSGVTYKKWSEHGTPYSTFLNAPPSIDLGLPWELRGDGGVFRVSYIEVTKALALIESCIRNKEFGHYYLPYFIADIAIWLTVARGYSSY